MYAEMRPGNWRRRTTTRRRMRWWWKRCGVEGETKRED